VRDSDAEAGAEPRKEQRGGTRRRQEGKTSPARGGARRRCGGRRENSERHRSLPSRKVLARKKKNREGARAVLASATQNRRVEINSFFN
jgi:hypothetical protein